MRRSSNAANASKRSAPCVSGEDHSNSISKGAGRTSRDQNTRLFVPPKRPHLSGTDPKCASSDCLLHSSASSSIAPMEARHRQAAHAPHVGAHPPGRDCHFLLTLQVSTMSCAGATRNVTWPVHATTQSSSMSCAHATRKMTQTVHATKDVQIYRLQITSMP